MLENRWSTDVHSLSVSKHLIQHFYSMKQYIRRYDTRFTVKVFFSRFYCPVTGQCPPNNSQCAELSNNHVTYQRYVSHMRLLTPIFFCFCMKQLERNERCFIQTSCHDFIFDVIASLATRGKIPGKTSKYSRRLPNMSIQLLQNKTLKNWNDNNSIFEQLC